MTKNKDFKNKLLIAAATCLTLVPFGGTILVEAATSGIITVTGSIVGGDISISDLSSQVNFGQIEVTDSVRLTSSLGKFTVTDYRGTNEGWHVTAKATPMRSTSGATALPTGTLTLDTSKLKTPTVLPTGTAAQGILNLDDGSTHKLVSFEAGSGSGVSSFEYDDDSLIFSTLPGQKLIEGGATTSYQSTITVTVVTGP